MPVVAHASKDVIEVCEELFTDSRWNCSTIRLAPNFLPDLTGGELQSSTLGGWTEQVKADLSTCIVFSLQESYLYQFEAKSVAALVDDGGDDDDDDDEEEDEDEEDDG